MNLRKIFTSLLVVAMVLSIVIGVTAYETEISSIKDFIIQNELELDFELSIILAEDEDFDVSTCNLGLTAESFEGQSATFMGSRILTLIALGENPYSFEGYNLISKLLEKAEDGVFGSVYDQVYSLLALNASGAKIEESMINALVQMQLNDGGFGFTMSDPDSTALALIALANFEGEEVENTVERALIFLENIQLDSGGFASYGSENSNSTAMVSSALVALGIDIDDQRFVKEGNVVDALEQFKLSNGGYGWVSDETENNYFSLKQVLLAYTDLNNGYNLFNSLRASIDIDLRIEGLSDNILSETVRVKLPEKNVLTTKTLLEYTLSKNDIPFEIESASFGSYLKSINNINAGHFGSYDGWLYLVNMESGQGIDNDKLSNNDSIIIYYGDMSPNTLIPSIKISPNELRTNQDIIFTISSTYFEYDESWNETEKTINVSGAVLEINDETYVTDENGQIVLKLEPGKYSYLLHQDTAGEVPGLLRMTGQIEVMDEYKYQDDQKISLWAKQVVYKARALGAMSGANDLFRPQDNVSRAEAISMLMRLKGIESVANLETSFTDLVDGSWYYQVVATAESLGYLEDMYTNEFSPNQAITREEFANLIYLMNDLKVGNEYMFIDRDEISFLDAVDAVFNKGLIVGSGNLFYPKDELTREMAAAILTRINDLE